MFKNEKPYSLNDSLNKARVIKCRRLRWAGNVGNVEKSRDAFKYFTRKRILGRSIQWWENNILILPILINFKEMGVNTRNCVGSFQDGDYWITLVNEE